MKVFAVIKDVRYEGAEIVAVYFSETMARGEAMRLAQAKPEDYSRGITYEVEGHEVQG